MELVISNVYLFKNMYGETAIVRVQDEAEGFVYYISQVPAGLGHGLVGEHIAVFGAPFPKTAGDALYSLYEWKNYSPME